MTSNVTKKIAAKTSESAGDHARQAIDPEKRFSHAARRVIEAILFKCFAAEEAHDTKAIEDLEHAVREHAVRFDGFVAEPLHAPGH